MNEDDIVRETGAVYQYTSKREMADAYDRLLKEIDRLDDVQSAEEAHLEEAADRIKGDLNTMPIHFVHAVLEAGQPGDAVYQLAYSLDERSTGFWLAHLPVLHDTVLALDQSKAKAENSIFSDQEVERMRMGIIKKDVSALLTFLHLKDNRSEAIDLALKDVKAFSEWLEEQVEAMDMAQYSEIEMEAFRNFRDYLKKLDR